MKRWIQSLEGRQLEPLSLKKEQVGSIEEIAHALAGKNRFTCQSARRYSVGEHCVRGSDLLPAAFAGAFLLHELSEVYLPDIAGPIKASVFVLLGDDVALSPEDEERCHNVGLTRLAPWSALERQHTRVMLDALGLNSLESLIYSPEVKAMDRAMLVAEKRDLLGPAPEPWSEDEERIAPATPHKIEPWTPQAAAEAFVIAFARYFKR